MKKTILKVIGYTLVLASFYFIYYTFRKIEFSQIAFIFQVKWISIILVSSLVYSLISFLRAYNWEKLLFFFSGKNTPGRELSSIYLKTEIAKYIPSNMVHFAGRHLLAKKYHYTHTQLVFSNVFDMALVAAAAALMAFMGFIFGAVVLPAELLAFFTWQKLLVGLGAALFLLGLILFKKKAVLSSKIQEFLSWNKLFFGVKIFGWYFIVFFISGGLLFGLFYFMDTGALDFYSYLRITVGYSLAWLSGFVIPGAPGGLGIREAVLIFLFTPLFGEATTLAAGLMLRIITILGDVWAFFYGTFLQVKAPKP